MSTKHTRGPWMLLPDEADKPYVRIRGSIAGTRFKIANVLKPIYEGAPDWEVEETRANVALVAAAPDLLEFAELVLRGIDSGHIKAAPFLDMNALVGDSIPMRTIGEAARAVIAKATGEAL
ncbi:MULTISPECIES: hypothetical protein [unclassified Caballeronia]|uniref:hypothetical protein n=1 Tax=unclassified Caballeronia TaxID=2646786 RepID=UPI00286137F8|nr:MULTISPECIES: hypothetical protein [unclassified Caballeronia]MDR5776243.1 hypothetical protein [Caballeronia sp. LZ002]MDR5851683.1 hypothetical protein [Caballeronia sp. LZ003]